MRSLLLKSDNFGSPSARQRERVWGRWDYTADLSTQSGRAIHVVKQLVGAPVPWLLLFLPFVLAVSRNTTEVVSWSIGILTLLYIGLDQFAERQEFRFYPLGTDFPLGAVALAGLISVIMSYTQDSSVTSAQMSWALASLRWVALLYLFTYALELFPGLNRIFLVLIASSSVVVTIGLIQHFQGVDWIRGLDLQQAGTPSGTEFAPIALFHSTEALGAYLSCVLPFSAAYAVFGTGAPNDTKTRTLVWCCRLLTVGIVTLIVLTFRPEFWKTAAVGAVALVFFKSEFSLRHYLALIISGVVFALATTVFLSPLPAETTLELAETFRLQEIRAEGYRESMTELLRIWEQNPFLGSQQTLSSTADAINIYFLLLARVGLIGLIGYLSFIVWQLLNTLRLFQEIPASHSRHRILIGASFCSQCAFHACGLYWGTLFEPYSLIFFVLTGAMTAYMAQHYRYSLVPDDKSL